MAAMTGKELLQLARDTLLVLAVLYLFTLDIMMAGGVKMDLNKANVVVHDMDHSLASRELIYRFQPPYFQLGGEILDQKEGIRMLDQGEALVVLDIPPRFQHDLLQGRPTAV
jgi:ABC-2 type transport system permease protein